MENESFFKGILDSVTDGIYFVDRDRKITFWNKGAEMITGFSADDVLGSYCNNNILRHVDENGTELCVAGCPLAASADDGMDRTLAIYLHHKLGHRVPVIVNAMPLREEGEITGVVEVFRDDSSRRDIFRIFEELKAQTLRDELTGLPNRRYMETFLRSREQEFATLGIPFGILFMDVDKFKALNDSCGHDAGDEVLRMIANTLGGNVRASDLIGRWGGEEFVGAFVSPSLESLGRIAEKLRILIARSSVMFRGIDLNATVSIGATLFKRGDTVEDAVKRADTLMYQSKAAGRNIVTLG